jgi:predicted Rossmann fold nucleotide-binding protein DprA/Smf involved in DNA uptake
MTTPDTKLSRSEALKQLRTKHAGAVERTQALLKEQKHMQQQLCDLMRNEPKTIPQLAEASGLPSDKVLWFVAALRKYGIVVENGMSGDYPLYQKAEAS